MDVKLVASPREAQNLSSESKRGGWISFPFFIGISFFFDLFNSQEHYSLIFAHKKFFFLLFFNLDLTLI